MKLIHMNGRAYDYQLGRFLSVDPFIQMPANSQSLNPYSYILNNPLSGTDPSGYQYKTPSQTMEDFHDVKHATPDYVGASAKSNGQQNDNQGGQQSDDKGKIGAPDKDKHITGGMSDSTRKAFKVAGDISQAILEKMIDFTGAVDAVGGVVDSGLEMQNGDFAGATETAAATAAGVVTKKAKALKEGAEGLKDAVTKKVDPNNLQRTHSISGKASSKKVDQISNSMRQDG